MDTLGRLIDRRIREMLPSNATVETPATTTYLLIACLDSKIYHRQNMP